jgi:hypothetical protein
MFSHHCIRELLHGRHALFETEALYQLLAQ